MALWPSLARLWRMKTMQCRPVMRLAMQEVIRAYAEDVRLTPQAFPLLSVEAPPRVPEDCLSLRAACFSLYARLKPSLAATGLTRACSRCLAPSMGASQSGGRGRPNREGALGTRPDRQVAIGRPGRRGDVGFDVAMMDRLRGELPFDDDIRLPESRLHVPKLVLDMAGDIALDARVVTPGKAFDPQARRHLLM